MDFDSDPLIKTTDKTDSLEMVRYMVKMRVIKTILSKFISRYISGSYVGCRKG